MIMISCVGIKLSQGAECACAAQECNQEFSDLSMTISLTTAKFAFLPWSLCCAFPATVELQF